MFSGIGNMGSVGSMMQQRSNPSQRFSKIDSDGNGLLNQEEFGAISERLAKVSGTELNVEEMFSKFDSDGDGGLNMEEVQSFMKENHPKPFFSSKGSFNSGGIDFQSKQFNDLLDLLKTQDGKDESFSLFDVKV